MTDMEPDTAPSAADTAVAPPPPMPRLMLSSSLYSSFNPYAEPAASATPGSQPDFAPTDQSQGSQDKSSQEKDGDDASSQPQDRDKQRGGDRDEDGFLRPAPVVRTKPAADAESSSSSSDSESKEKGDDDDEDDDDEGDWFKDLERPAEGAPGTEAGEALRAAHERAVQEKRQAKKLQRLKEKELRLKEKELRKKDKSKAKKKSKADDKARDTEKDKDAKEAEVGGSADAPPPDDGDEQAPQASAAHMDARRKAARLIREMYRRPTNMPALPPPEIVPEQLIADIRERAQPIIEEKKMLLRMVGLGGPAPHPSPSLPGLSADSVDDVASASAAGEEPSGRGKEEDAGDVEFELIISPPTVAPRRPRPPLLPPPTTQELEAESEQQLAASGATSQTNTPAPPPLQLRMPTQSQASQDLDALPQTNLLVSSSRNPLAHTTTVPLSSLSSSQVSESMSQSQSVLPALKDGNKLAEEALDDGEDGDEIAAVLAAAGLAPPESEERRQAKKAADAKSKAVKAKEELSSVIDFSDDEGPKDKKKKKRAKTGDEEVLGDSDEGAPSSEEEGEELVSEERSNDEEADLEEEDLHALSSSEDDGGAANPHSLFKRIEDEEFDAGIAAMQRRLTAKKAEFELPTQRRKRKGGDEEEEEAGDEDDAEGLQNNGEELAATLPVGDDYAITAAASLERGASATHGSDEEDERPLPMRPPAPRDEAMKRRRLLSSSSLLDEPDAKEVLAAMRPAGSFRQAPQALRERRGTSFIGEKAERDSAPSNSKGTSSSSSLSASASLSLSHTGYVFGRDSGGARPKPAAAPAAAVAAATSKEAPESAKKRTQRPGAGESAPLTKKGSQLLSVLSQNNFK